MALFQKKKADDKKEKEPAKKNVTAVPAQKSVKSSAPAKKNTTEVKKTAAVKPAAKAPAKATASKPAAKSTAKAAPEKAVVKNESTKPVVPAAVKKVSEPATKKTAVGGGNASRPFFMSCKEDIKALFDQAIAEADYEILKNGAKAAGKYEFELEVDGYHFYLIANNGQILFDSPSFTTLVGALGGIKTFKKAVEGGKFEIKGDKYNRYRFILERKYYGENYASKDQCTKCVESVKKFANNSKIIRYTPDKDAVRAFELAKISKRTPEDIDWKAIELAEKEASKMGKFEICREDDDHYCFYLLANNGQILYASRYYTTEAAARKGVDSFKRATYVGNFFVDRDKFGNYRYVLKNIGSAPNFIGESYDNKPQCEKIIDSVKNFVVTATVELENE